MKRTIIILYVVLTGWINGVGQISPERLALKNLTKHKWDKVSTQMKKTIRKDSLNSTAPFVMAQYFFSTGNPSFQVDSAYAYTLLAIKNFQRTPVKYRDRLKKFPLDSLILIQYRKKIDSAAFARAKSIHSVEGFDYFLQSFPLAEEIAQAIDLRNEVAYNDALAVNTHQGFKMYMQKYPHARRFDEAKHHYNRLLYLDKTRDLKLESYTSFLYEYPDTPYRNEIEKNIFEISVASGNVEQYEEYLSRYPASAHVGKAKSILFHLLKEHQRLTSIPFLKSDSLNCVLALEQPYLVPFLHKNKFGFMDQEGAEILTTEATDISDEYLCGNIVNDMLMMPNGILARNGSFIYKGDVISVEDIGAGFLLIEKENGLQVIHKTGFAVGDSIIQDAKTIQASFLALKKTNRWSVWTFTGRKVLDFEWDDISETGLNIILHQQGKYSITTVQAVAAVVNQQRLVHSDFFDEVKSWTDHNLWCRKGELHGILDADLNTYLPFEKQVLTQAFCGTLAKQPDAIRLYKGNTLISTYQDVVLNKPWAAFLFNGEWLLSRPHEKFESVAFDSILYAGPFAIGMKGEVLLAYINETKKIEAQRPARFTFIPGQDSSMYLVLEQEQKKTVYNEKGKKLFTVAYDKIQYGGEGTFIVTHKEKKGVINSDGKVLLAFEYDAIAPAKGGVLSLLKATKFGLYNIHAKKLIKPAYNKNLVTYNAEFLVAFKDGAFGFIRWDNKPASDFDFSEVQYWTDSTALVKRNYAWALYDVASGKIKLDKVKDYKIIQESPSGKLAIVHHENQYGVLHSKRGFIIPATFSDIVNVGSAEVPLYFTEKHVEEASIFIVIYYNSEGRMLRKEVYEHDEYEKIYCSGKK